MLTIEDLEETHSTRCNQQAELGLTLQKMGRIIRYKVVSRGVLYNVTNITADEQYGDGEDGTGSGRKEKR